MTLCIDNRIKQFAISIAALLLPNLAMALGLGEAQGQPIIGQPLRLEIPIINAEAKKPDISCFTVQLPRQEIDGSALPKDLRVELVHQADQSKLTLTAGPIRDPIISFAIKAGCGFEISRDYLLLPDINKEVRVPVTRGAAQPSVRPITPKTDSALSVPVRGGESIPILSETTLEKLARERYPLQPKAREKFMRMMMVANSGVTDTAQIIAAGTSLQIPNGLPISRSASPKKPDSTKQSTPSLPSAESLPTAKRKAPKQDKLVIGANADNPEQKILAELERLIPLMREQNLYQDGMIRKIANLEEDYKQLQQRFAKLEERVIAIDKELQVQKSTPPPTQFDVIELTLATLLGGVLAGLAMLLWQRHNYRQNSLHQPDNQIDASPSVIATMSVQGNPIISDYPPPIPQSTSPAVVPAAVAAESLESSIQADFSEIGLLTEEDSADPVAEADVLMAYGRDSQAEEILLEGLKTDPTRDAIHLKLLEIYVGRKDLAQFEAVAKELRLLNGGEGRAWSKAKELARALGVSTDVIAAEQVIAETPPAPTEELQEDFPAAAAMAPVQTSAPIEEDVGSFEFDLDLGSISIPAAAEQAVPAPVADEVVSLNFDFNVGTTDTEAQLLDAHSPKIDAVTKDKAGNAIDIPIEADPAAESQSPIKEDEHSAPTVLLDFPLNGLPSELRFKAESAEATPDKLQKVLDFSEQK